MGIQVTELTQNLMPWGKEYIDFSFAGRHISEFGLVAVTSSDRYQFPGSPEFKDEVSEVNGVWGQYYWGTNFKTRTYTYSLATDGMTERQFEEFKRLFRPGHYGQFYEDTWFERYCYVRVKNVLDFTFVPFQEQVEVAGVKFPSRVYRGECKLVLIQDKPFLHSFYQVLDSKISDLNNKTDNGRAALRAMYHSNIPAQDSWKKDVKCCIGADHTLSKNGELSSVYYDKISSIPFYNPSTFDAECQLEFTLQRTTSTINTIEWEPVYFDEIYTDITKPNTPYNLFGVTENILSTTSLEYADAYKNCFKYFKYTLPEISSEINKAINVAWMFYSENPNGALIDLQERLQEEVVNIKVLVWAIKILQKIQVNQKLYYPEDYEEDQTIDGQIIGDTIEAQQYQIFSENYDDAQGLVILHAGDYEKEFFNLETDQPGCFRSNKIKVYTSTLDPEVESLMVDWFGYFNIMMLMMHAECNPWEQGDITTKNTFSNFRKYKLKFDGEKAQAFCSYVVNYMEGDGIINQEEIVEEDCSNIIQSEYLLLDGGDIINPETGTIASYHLLKFYHGIENDLEVENACLKYKYTYA